MLKVEFSENKSRPEAFSWDEMAINPGVYEVDEPDHWAVIIVDKTTRVFGTMKDNIGVLQQLDRDSWAKKKFVKSNISVTFSNGKKETTNEHSN